jgi:fucose 4-O-acetylase-like acetyltransferase
VAHAVIRAETVSSLENGGSALARCALRTSKADGSNPSVQRDPVMDLARVICLALVVAGHLLMLGAFVSSHSVLVIERTLLLQPWFTPVTWIAQVMPLFFVVGGFAGARSWRRMEARGGSPAEFILARVQRLARPAIPLFAVLALAILVMQLSGLAPVAVAQIMTGVASPLWFLAAYTFSQAYLPGMAALHAIAPLRTLVGLAAAAVALDVLRYTTHSTVLGLFNMIFVWLFIQQLGIWAEGGWFAARSRLNLVLLAIASYVTLGVITTLGPYPANMLDNLNPPTIALAVLATAQFTILTLLHPLLTRAMENRTVQLIVAGVSSRLMTVYLWHLPVLAFIVGVLLLTPLPMPAPGSAAWWATRPLILVATVLALVGISRLLGRLERPAPLRPGQRMRVSDLITGASAALVIIPPFIVVAFGLNLGIAVAGAVLLYAAVLLPRGSLLVGPLAKRELVRVDQQHDAAQRERDPEDPSPPPLQERRRDEDEERKENDAVPRERHIRGTRHHR